MPTLGETMHLNVGSMHDRTATEDRRTQQVAIADFVSVEDLLVPNGEQYNAAAEIADFITAAINDGRLAHGSKLQSRAVLAEKFKVSTMTLNSAFKLLKERGKVASHGAHGTFVIGPSRSRQ